MPTRLALALVGAFILHDGLGRQQPPTFHAETRLVVLHATVKNSRGELVTALDRDAFAVYENGKRQPITLFRRDDIPVSLGLLIDNSGSMRTVRSRIETAALDLVRASNPQDEVFVLNFADKARIDVPFTSDVRVLEAGIARVDSIGGTALRDAVDTAEKYVHRHATRDRKVLLVVTDGNDNASITTMSQIRDAAERSDTVIYAVGLFGEADSSKGRQGRRELDELTERTGGVAYYPATLDQIDSVALDLARQIRNQYTIAYAPVNQALDGTYRRIRVDAAGRERLAVRTRVGYWATGAYRGIN
jgi:VWFA-related protein